MNISSTHRTLLVLLAFFALSTAAVAQRWNWVSTGAGVSFDDVWSLAIAPNGDLYTTGAFSDSVVFDGQKITAFGNYDAFTARHNNKGNILQASSHGGFDVDDARSVVVDKDGNMYFAGAFALEAIVAGEYVEAISENSVDMWVAKLDKTGALVWVKVFGSPTYDEGAPYLAVDSLLNVYVAGGFGGTATFGTRTVTSGGKLDIFVAKLTSTGDVVWVNNVGSSENDEALNINVTRNGDRIYTCASFIGRVTFGAAGVIESFDNKADLVVLSMNNNGQAQWAKRIGYSGVDRHIAATLSTDGKLVTTGAMSLTTTFDTQTLKANGENASDIFLCRFTRDGAIDLLKSYGGTFEDVGLAVRTDAKGAMLIGGYFDSTTVIGPNAAESAGGRDGLVMRILADGQVDWVQTMGGEYDDEIRGVALDTKNVPYVAGVFDTYAWFGDRRVTGDKFSDVFVAALECGPATWIDPRSKTLSICEGQDTILAVRHGYPVYEWYVDGAVDPAVRSSRYPTPKLTVGEHRVFCRITGFDDCLNNSDTVIVTVRPGLPEPTITRNGEELSCSQSGVKYQWYREGVRISGATNQTVQIQGDGNYRVLISDTTGCSRWSDNFLVGTTDVVEREDGSVIRVFPNPTFGTVTIAGASGSNVVVTDAMGREIARYANIGDQHTLVLDGAVGMYAVTIRSGAGARTLFVTKR